MTPQVSVIIPTYNHRDYVLETLGSVFAQTFTDHEIVVVNDGSPDDTAAVLAPLAREGRIRYIEQANGGQAAARNRGVAEAKGEFIAFLDDDDIWPPDKLEWQVKAMSDVKYALVGGIAGFIEDGSRISPVESEAVTEFDAASLFRGNPFRSPGQVLIRRSVLQSVGGLDEAIWGSDDLDLYIRIAMVGSVVRVNRCALYYRKHATNASNSKEKMFWNSLLVIRKNLCALPPESRKHARRSAYRWLYDYAGRAAMRFPDRTFASTVRLFGAMAGAAVRDGSLARDLAVDVLPQWLRTRVRRLCGLSAG